MIHNDSEEEKSIWKKMVDVLILMMFIAIFTVFGLLTMAEMLPQPK
jgi:hypothetical protein